MISDNILTFLDCLNNYTGSNPYNCRDIFMVINDAFSNCDSNKSQNIHPNKNIICKKDENLIINKVKLSYHRLGEKGIVVEKVGPKGRENVKVKVLFTLWIIFFLWILLISLLINTFV